MPSTPAAVSAQRTIHARRTRVRRGVPGYATNGGSRDSSGSEGKSEESEVSAGSASHNRFAVLRAQEPAPGVQEGREYTVSLSSGFDRERTSTLPLQNDLLSTEPLSLSEKVKGKPVAPTSSATTLSKRTSKSRLARHTPTNSAPLNDNQQPPVPVPATTSSTKPQAQPSRLFLQIDTLAARSLKLSSTSNLTSSDSITEAPLPRSISPDPLASLPEPPMPPDPMADPSLATLPKSPSPDFRYLTSPKFCETINGQFVVPKPTSSDNFHNGDSLHHVVRTIRGKIFWMAAEIAATNERSALKPVGSVLIPGAATKCKGRVDRTKLNRTSGDYVNSREDTEGESDEEDGGAEEWLGKDEDFWKQSFEKGSVVDAKTQTSEEGGR